MDLPTLRKLVRLMEQADLTELEVDDQNAGTRVHLKRGAQVGDGANGGASVQPVVHVHGAGGAAPSPGAAMPAVSPGPTAVDEPGVTTFDSPMVGTFYRSASPDSDPFVDLGSQVTEDSVLCILEAMKVMNEIRAELRGEVTAILVENGEPVEFGQPLFKLRTS